jgi:hypothetical protein
MKKLILHHHLGLGDHFVCNGLVNYISDIHETIYLACKKSNFNTIKCLYSENKKVKVFSISNENTEVAQFSNFMNLPILRVGFEYCNRNEWNTSFYSQLSIDFSVRYNRFYLPKTIPYEDQVFELFAKDEYCLVHRETSEGSYDIQIDTKLPMVEISKNTDPYKNLISYRKLIKNAKEIHCVNSSVFHLVDSLDLKSKLVYHDVRSRDFKIENKWKIIKYD